MKRFLPLVSVFALIVVGIAALHASSMSNGAPQLNCIQCHVGADKNPADFVVEGLPDKYEPGKTYKITIKITKGPDCSGGVACGGFAVQVNAGELIVTDDKNTFISTTPTGEKLLTHTKDGSMKREWSFEWKAPDTAEPVTFKIAVIAANGDGSFNGDAYAAKEVTVEPAGGQAAPTTTTKIVTETTTTTMVTTTPVGTTTEHNTTLAIGIAIVVFIIVVGGYILLTRK
ncbi:hypothetical protein Pyrde_1151 [Pyrodictium delaneyi]|uniref:Reelin domain-containing protein n=1 Tax=Pyrodictium delaneyi TaxID=1273541 RepID=A0A0P0N3U3_9CREN|nr:Reeler domain-containing protein [Pyrodictium delaneyi]ALL01199.1 hypothetical protein Pyrde_1151 [Pyrodictium delaneyi]OWJ55722.1 hypothetical protein Pdsh_02800 [Pyrodictium delaneyi]